MSVVEKDKSPVPQSLIGANDNLPSPIPSIHVDTALKLIARALGRQIARDMMRASDAANDNDPLDST